MKMDKKLVSEQKHEAEYIAKKYKIPISVIRKAMKEGGQSRRKIYKILREWGYTIKTK
jgi:hypothetical protein